MSDMATTPARRSDVRGALLAPVLVAIIGMLLVQTALGAAWVVSRRNMERRANLDAAKLVELAFSTYIRDLRHRGAATGRMLAGMEPFSPAQANGILAQHAQGCLSVSYWYYARADGQIIAASNPKVIGRSVRAQGYFREILFGKEWAVSDLTMDPDSNASVFMVVCGVRESGGALKGAVIAVVDPVYLGALVLSNVRSEEGLLTLFDRQGNLVYRSNDMPEDRTNLASADPILRQALAGKPATGIIVSSVDGETRVVAREPIENFGWTAGASRPLKVVMRPVYRVLLGVGLLDVMVMVLTLMVVRRARARLATAVATPVPPPPG
jgi:C4-dicarboxylate-specific signal transduction histidine kinase